MSQYNTVTIVVNQAAKSQRAVKISSFNADFIWPNLRSKKRTLALASSWLNLLPGWDCIREMVHLGNFHNNQLFFVFLPTNFVSESEIYVLTTLAAVVIPQMEAIVIGAERPGFGWGAYEERIEGRHLVLAVSWAKGFHFILFFWHWLEWFIPSDQHFNGMGKPNCVETSLKDTLVNVHSAKCCFGKMQGDRFTSINQGTSGRRDPASSCPASSPALVTCGLDNFEGQVCPEVLDAVIANDNGDVAVVGGMGFKRPTLETS